MKELVRYLIAGVIISIMIAFIEMRFAERDAQRAYNKYLQDNQSSFEPSYYAKSNDILPRNDSVNKNGLPLALSPILADWKRIYIDDIGTIDVPPTMEIQSGKYKEIIDPLIPELMKSMGVDASPSHNIIIQQKDLNHLSSSAFQRYARVMIDTDIKNFGDFDTLYFDIDEYTSSDIAEIDNMFHSLIISGMAGTQLKLVEWLPVKLEIINGMSCIHISYIRQLNNNPTVIVHLYDFQNIDRMYTLTLSYRQNEADYWFNDFDAILKSFRIQNIK
jgi:hypothetical protein